ncbi:iron-sulfur cluster assembly accessory protein [bacterium]|jgi:iron-sulfur cluster assembly protein|nr:iron-sulfur cluster assembly accessory protein [bacterium]MBT4250140.1 iron-sulfur cluster assembly accessory protein [bacterium]MBT4928263.1 iron-sulfur cluster assembly accessory protein [bacterium]MBT5733369.1 iron-sulfur cluster assembly accessory protein [bacterium]MBT6019364.1 iron-sulfur cluster assembly accessory protein [bacterium]
MGINNIKEQKVSIEKEQNDFKDAQIYVSKKAVTRLKAVMSSEGKSDYFLRMSVDSGGCSGMNYKMDFDKEQDTFDKVFNQNGLNVICDLKSWLYLKNITIDYSDDMLNGGFKIENPNAERTCGCGTSFSA